MRHVWVLALLIACGHSEYGDDVPDAPGPDAFTCSLSLEGTHCDSAHPVVCSVEGNPSCTTLPTSGGCDCGSDNTWHCYCSCYGPRTTCELACPSTSTSANGAACDTDGYQCPYADRTCTCTDDGAGSLKFSCT